MTRRIVRRLLNMTEIVQFALTTLRERSPVGSGDDPHPGLYRDSHMVFVDGQFARDMTLVERATQINISNPVPYARKIETGRMKLSVPANVYEESAQVVASRYGNSVSVKFTYMPVRFGGVDAFAQFSTLLKKGRRSMNAKARRDWLVRQPSIEIKRR